MNKNGELMNLRKLTKELAESVQKAESVREIAEDARRKAEEARMIAEDARERAEKIRLEIFNKLKIVFEEL